MADTTRPFRIYCDASNDGFGSTLEQEQRDGSIRPIVYTSFVRFLLFDINATVRVVRFFIFENRTVRFGAILIFENRTVRCLLCGATEFLLLG